MQSILHVLLRAISRRSRWRAHRIAGAIGLILACLALQGRAQALDVNQASAVELQKLRGLGAKTAALIVKERARGGAYESIENLAERVKGLGAKKVRALQAQGLRAGHIGAAQRAAQPGNAPSGASAAGIAPAITPSRTAPVRTTSIPDAIRVVPQAAHKLPSRPRRPMPPSSRPAVR